MTSIFLDVELSSLTQNAQLLSVSLVPESGPWFYFVFNDADRACLSSWHLKNVIPHLELTKEQLTFLSEGIYLVNTTGSCVEALQSYLAEFEDVVMWSDVPAYDWVLFCELFGGALGVPRNVHYIIRDLATLLEAKGYDVDTDRFALAYGDKYEAESAKVSSPEMKFKDSERGLLRHNALGDALAGLECWKKLMQS